MINQIPRPEHPRPDFQRENWLNLNGVWQFAFDEENKGMLEKWYACGHALPKTITVPFCHQSELSGLNDKRLCSIIWYKRSVSLPESMRGKRILLQFGAVDYRCQVYVNGECAGEHTGGYVPFALDVTTFLTDGENELCVRVEDRADCTQPRGKQYWDEGWIGCWYTPVTGIWQTVYLEAVGTRYFVQAHITPDIDQGTANFKLTLDVKSAAALTADIEIRSGDTLVRALSCLVSQKTTDITVSMVEGESIGGFHHWSPENPHLYDVQVRLRDADSELDAISTYFGMRKIEVKDGWVLLNNSPYYQRLVLDQGYWPQSLITPPSDQAIREDVEWTKKFGYNGARKHQKVEDPRFYYWADKLGLLVWGEVPSAYSFTDESVRNLSDTLSGFIRRDYNHPSIVCWVPVNESWGVTRIYGNKQMQQAARMLYYQAKALDPTRIVSTNDGWETVDTDIIGLHDYAANRHTLAKHFADRQQVLASAADQRMSCADTFTPSGREAILITEYGGIAFQDQAGDETWGYHDKVTDEESFFKRYQEVTDAVRAIPYCQGYCYTQLTDVQQETNGLLTPSREPKIDVQRFRQYTINP